MRRAAALARGFLALALSVWALSIAVFCAAKLSPGDPLVSFYGERAERLTAEERAQAEERLGLDAPLYTQYLRWLSGAVRGEFGVSYQYRTEALSVIRSRAGNTLLLGGGAFALIFLLAPLLGLICARYEDKWPDRMVCRIGTIAGCVPEFWLSLLLILLFSVTLRLLPSGGAYSIGGGGLRDRAVHLILPMTAVVFGHLWYYAYLVRGLLLEETREEYVLLARAKGLSRGRVLTRHCLRCAAPSYLGAMALAVPHILGGTYVVETVFAYPGLGTLAYESARYHDYNLLMLLCLLSGAAVMICGAGARALGRRLDPRAGEGEAYGG